MNSCDSHTWRENLQTDCSVGVSENSENCCLLVLSQLSWSLSFGSITCCSIKAIKKKLRHAKICLVITKSLYTLMMKWSLLHSLALMQTESIISSTSRTNVYRRAWMSTESHLMMISHGCLHWNLSQNCTFNHQGSAWTLKVQFWGTILGSRWHNFCH